LRENDLGPVYGHQWRHFNAPYTTCDDNYDGKGVDQLAQIIECLKDPLQRTSRRMVMCAWNPCQLNEMALPPCHILAQFNVTSGNKLSCCMFQRSGDVGLGVPFNIASYSFLTHLLAKHCDLEPFEFIYYLGNAHIYDDHIESLEEQVKREPHAFPKIVIDKKCNSIEEYNIGNVTIENYICHETIKMKMRK
jgi:thymidylate synthase